MNKIVAFTAILLLVFIYPADGQNNAQNEPVNIDVGNGEEVIVHVYRNKTDALPFIEFSVIVDESSGAPRVSITEVEGRSTTGGFMIISGVRPAGDIGIQPSDTYNISFQNVSDYRIFEKTVIDYLRRLPVPEEMIDLELEVEEEDFTETNEDLVLDITPVEVIIPDDIEEPELEFEDEIVQEEVVEEVVEEVIDVDQPVIDYNELRSDTNSLLVHVHRDADDIEPFKEFILFKKEVDGKEVIKIVEVKGMDPSGQFIYMTGFTHTEEEGTIKSDDYDMTAYNIEDYGDYVEAVIEYMKRLTGEEFNGDVATIQDNWQDIIDEAEKKPEPEAPKEPAFSPIEIPRKEARKQKQQIPTEKELEKQAKEREQMKYKAPKLKKQYNVKKSKKMSGRMSGQRNKTNCFEFKN